jgi:tricorn protease
MRTLALMRFVPVAALVLMASLFLPAASAQSDPPLLLRFPTVSKTQIVFNYGGDLWIVGREGGDARRLTSGVGAETQPSFSPDGSTIAFTGEYDGNLDVYVVPATGGVPRRLTFHPAEEDVLGWTPDGKNVLFASWGSSFRHQEDQLYTVPVEGGFPTKLPIPIGEESCSLPTAPIWHMCLMCSGRRHGSVITVARRRRSGLPI